MPDGTHNTQRTLLTMVSENLIPPDDIRTRFARAMSDMYRREVPQYGTLLNLVQTINRSTLEQDPSLQETLTQNGTLERLTEERHGAIRLGTASELSICRRLFAIMGMFPVGYYDLSVAGIPVHSTAFRPVTDDALNRNPFRIFTSLLRLELIPDETLRQKAQHILGQRNIFTPALLTLIEQAETAGGLPHDEADRFVSEALETFRWHPDTTVDIKTYDDFAATHRLIADIVCFRGPHINHLTPRTLDIDAAQAEMPRHGIEAKAHIEGPPRRKIPILLRQTSFTALTETILFAGQSGPVAGHHTARFGEIEMRGIALTEKGRILYDTLLAKAKAGTQGCYEDRLSDAFQAFPDNADTLREQELAFFRYDLTGPLTPSDSDKTLDALITAGKVIATPITYEDFLPVSAAGIFQSNLGNTTASTYAATSSQTEFETALGTSTQNEITLYTASQARSLQAIHSARTLKT